MKLSVNFSSKYLCLIALFALPTSLHADVKEKTGYRFQEDNNYKPVSIAREEQEVDEEGTFVGDLLAEGKTKLTVTAYVMSPVRFLLNECTTPRYLVRMASAIFYKEILAKKKELIKNLQLGGTDMQNQINYIFLGAENNNIKGKWYKIIPVKLLCDYFRYLNQRILDSLFIDIFQKVLRWPITYNCIFIIFHTSFMAATTILDPLISLSFILMTTFLLSLIVIHKKKAKIAYVISNLLYVCVVWSIIKLEWWLLTNIEAFTSFLGFFGIKGNPKQKEAGLNREIIGLYDTKKDDFIAWKALTKIYSHLFQNQNQTESKNTGFLDKIAEFITKEHSKATYPIIHKIAFTIFTKLSLFLVHSLIFSR